MEGSHESLVEKMRDSATLSPGSMLYIYLTDDAVWQPLLPGINKEQGFFKKPGSNLYTRGAEKCQGYFVDVQIDWYSLSNPGKNKIILNPCWSDRLRGPQDQRQKYFVHTNVVESLYEVTRGNLLWECRMRPIKAGDIISPVPSPKEDFHAGG